MVDYDEVGSVLGRGKSRLIVSNALGDSPRTGLA